jgi:SAM-dependent methyltransferase
MTSLVIDYAQHHSRAERTRYLAGIFAPYISGRVLDVGCDQKVLKQLRPDLDYVGIDIGGNPDLHIDLETVEHLPFADREFDIVVCADVLEHLDNLHHVFGELVRVSRRFILISLPNCWSAARQPVARGKGHIGHYGLPAVPRPDRHKWFFSLTQARDFAAAAAAQHHLEIVSLRVREKPRLAVVRWLRRLRYPRRERYLNRYASTLWVVFERSVRA